MLMLSYYDKIKESGGLLDLVHVRYENDDDNADSTEDEDENKDEEKKGGEKPTGEVERFKRLMCGSSHARSGKAVFIREDLYEAVHTILLGGMFDPTDKVEFKKGCAKWNAYYALAATDSTPVTLNPKDKVIVINDFEREIKTTCDVVTIEEKEKEEENVKVKVKEYSLYCNQKDYTIKSKVFDGAGLVSVAMAEQWASDLGLDYIPASFQLRVIPGIKGNVYTFDIAKFVKERKIKGKEIVDIKGRKYTVEDDDDKIIILTESQVKFLSMYDNDIEKWRENFDTPVTVEVNGKTIEYKRTFNISEYSKDQKDIKKRRYTAYQHLQTVEITGDDAESLVSATMNRINEISKDTLEFLKYRQAIDETCGDNINTGNDDDKSKEMLPPYYKAAAEYVDQLKNQGMIDKEEIKRRLEKCFADSYFLNKTEDDIQGLKDGAYSGKLIVTGNYQVLTPDIYALCEYAFGDKDPQGLLKDDEIYSAWWLENEKKDKNRFNCDKLAITRNPQIYMESRIVNPARNEKLDKWFYYQKTGILMSSHSLVPYALGTADFDGDTVATTNNTVFLNAVKAEMKAGNRNIIYCPDSTKEEDAINELKKKTSDCTIYAKCGKDGNAPSNENMNDIQSLMTADMIAFKNNIGEVVNAITKIWNFDQNSEGYIQLNRSEQETEDFLAERRNYLKIMSIIGQLTLDAAKTGDEVVIPDDITNFVKNNSVKGFKNRMPNFMSHTKKYKKSRSKVKRKSLFSSLTMEELSTRIYGFLSRESSEMAKYIEDQYDAIGYFPFKLDEKGEKLREEYETLRFIGNQDKTEEALQKLVKTALKRTTQQFDFNEFKKIVAVGEVDKGSELYKMVKETMSVANKNFNNYTKHITKIDDNKQRQWQYKCFYKHLKKRLIALNGHGQELHDKDITLANLLDNYITAIYNGTSKEAAKDILWNCFGDEIIERIKKGEVSEREKNRLSLSN